MFINTSNTTDAMLDRHRVITMKLRLNQAESDALGRLTAAHGIGAAELIRRFIRQAANGK
jgi:hypothetical protein